MAANALSHNLLNTSAFYYPKKSISFISSHRLLSLTPRHSPLLSFSLEKSVAGFSSSLNRHFQCISASAESSRSDNGEAEADETLEKSEILNSENTEGAEEKPPRKPRIKLGDIMGILNKRAIEASEKQRPVPDLRTGDIVEIKLEVPENKRRLSVYKGIIISKQNAGIHTTIRIRRIIAGVGVEIVFPVYSPNIKEIKVVQHRKVRRARLYYLRDKLPRLSTFK